MIYRHTFRVRASQAAVAAFHQQSSSLGAITPPPIIMRVHAAPDQMGDGDQMDFTMWLGPLPIRWLAQIEAVSPAGFVDRQVSGPFKSWVHTHQFVAVDAQTTEVRDHVEAELGTGLYHKLVSLMMWVGLPVLFAYRGWQTRRLLEK